MKILLIDNYDSYTYNLYQLAAEVSGELPLVIKHDELSWEELQGLPFDVVIISPGPGSPDKREDFGICKQVIEELEKPILGVCLGHQGIYHVFGGNVERAPVPMHGRRSKIFHYERGLFQGLKQGIEVVRYHSLLCKGEVPKELQIDATTEDGLVMALSHKERPIWGVQFHPESICTQNGREMMENFLRLSEEYYAKREEISYDIIDFEGDGEMIFDALSTKYPKIQWLDSSKVEDGLSRFSIMGISSEIRGHVLKYDVEKRLVEKIDTCGTKEVFSGTIFDYLKEKQKKWKAVKTFPFDFQLGYIGYLGYELKKDCVGENRHHSQYPDAYLSYVDRALILDHKEKKLYFLSYADDISWVEESKNLIVTTDFSKERRNVFQEYPSVHLVKDKKRYLQDIRKCQELIAAGETYEVCLTNRLDVEGSVDPVNYYKILREVSPAPYSALLRFDEVAIASSSMEKFLTIHQDCVVETKPIKGTVRRGATREEDEMLKTSLEKDEKNQSENLMIVDLLRNDLGKVCEVGTVIVPKLMHVESYSTVHQLVTTVQGKIAKDRDNIDVIQACFPGGSMTGAPKKRTLEIIDRLEDVPRGIYSGCIGYLSNNGCVDLNIVIRTVVIEKEKASLGVGGAIIALSDPEEEFDEILLKAKGVLGAFQRYYKGNRGEEIYINGSEEEK